MTTKKKCSANKSKYFYNHFSKAHKINFLRWLEAVFFSWSFHFQCLFFLIQTKTIHINSIWYFNNPVNMQCLHLQHIFLSHWLLQLNHINISIELFSLDAVASEWLCFSSFFSLHYSNKNKFILLLFAPK